MFAVTAAGAPADTHSVYTLLNLLTDPAAVKQRLDLLLSQQAVAEQASAKAREQITYAHETQGELDKQTALLAAAQQEHGRNVAAFKTLVVRSEQDLAGHTRTLTEQRAHLTTWNAELDQREQILSQRETSVQKTREQLNTRLEQTDALHKQLTAKLAKITEIQSAGL